MTNALFYGDNLAVLRESLAIWQLKVVRSAIFVQEEKMKLSSMLCAAVLAFAVSMVGATTAFAKTECPSNCVVSGGYCYCKLPQDTLKPTHVPELGTVCNNSGAQGTVSMHAGKRVCGISANSFNKKASPENSNNPGGGRPPISPTRPPTHPPN
jgi:hypothetical protein